MVNLGAHAKSLGEGLRTNRSDHEFLDVHAGVSVCAAVENVHHWHRQYVCIRATDVAVQRQCSGLCSGLGCGNGNAQDSVSAELGLVIGTVQLNQCLVNEALVVGFEASNFVGNLLVDVLNSLQNTLTLVALATVAQLVSLVHTGRSTGRNAGNTAGAVVKEDLGLDGWVATGIKNFAGESVDDISHAVFHSS